MKINAKSTIQFNVEKNKIIKQIEEFYELMNKVEHKNKVFDFKYEILEKHEKIQLSINLNFRRAS